MPDRRILTKGTVIVVSVLCSVMSSRANVVGPTMTNDALLSPVVRICLTSVSLSPSRKVVSVLLVVVVLVVKLCLTLVSARCLQCLGLCALSRLRPGLPSSRTTWVVVDEWGVQLVSDVGLRLA